MKKCLLSLLLILLLSPLQSQISAVDSLKNQLKTAVGTTEVDILNALMKSQLCRNNDEALAYYREIETALLELTYPKGMVESMKNYGTLMYCSGDIDSALFLYDKAGDLARENDFKKVAGAIYNNMGTMYRLKADHQNALKNYEICYELGTDVNDTMLIISSLDGMGVVYKKKGNTDQALENFLLVEKVAIAPKYHKALLSTKINIASIYLDGRYKEIKESELLATLALAEKLDDAVSQAAVLQLLGDLLYKHEEYAKALSYLEKGLKINKSTGEKRVESYLYQGIGNIYHQRGEYSAAIGVNNKAIQLAKEAGLTAALPLLYSNNASNFLELNEYDKCIAACQEAISFSQQTEQLEDNVDAYKYLAQAYAKSGLPLKAYETQVKYTELMSEFRDRAQSKKLVELQTKYEADKKEVEIAQLSQQSAIQALEIKQKNQTIVVGVITFLFISILVFFLYKQRMAKKRESQIELEQRFLRSQLNPHFIFNALMAIQNFMMKNDAPVAAQYLSKFSMLMREILENSRQEFIPVSAEVDMLTHYMDIHKLRLQNAFDYHIIVDEDIDPESYLIPPMFVQPFVENAIEHGIATIEKGLIHIRFIKDQSHITIEVTDNGKGIEVIDKTTQGHHSLASTIIQERIDLLNQSLKTKIKLLVENIKNQEGEVLGARVELKVPFV